MRLRDPLNGMAQSNQEEAATDGAALAADCK